MKKTDCIPFQAELKKIVRIMRVTAFLVFFLSMHMYGSSFGQNEKLNLSMHSTFKDVIEQLEKISSYRFVLKNNESVLDKVVEARYTDQSIQRILDDLMKDSGYTYRIVDRYIAIIPVSEKTQTEQTKQVTGTVTDHSGTPLPGVSVVVKGTITGSITDASGKFMLSNIPPDAVLVFSFVGMKSQEIPVSGKNIINAKLEEEPIGIEEIVAIGYGVQKKVNLSGSVASVNVEELVESRPITNLSNALTGMAAGVMVTSANNRPGNDNASILVRGQGTLNNSSPLIIIDGVESPINSVNPQDVAGISVLKDAASASIYGSRAANGVILITTKQGEKGTIKLDYNGYVSFESIRKTLDPVSNYADYMEYINEGMQNSNLARIFSDEKIAEWRNGNDPIRYPNTDWIDATFTNSVATNHVLSMSGGGDKFRFYSSFGYMENPGVMDNSGQQKYSARVNLEGDIRPWLTAGINVNGYYSDLEAATDNIEDVFTYASATTPGMLFRHPDGRYGAMNNTEDDPQSAVNNPLRRLNSITGQYDRNNLRARFFGTLRPFDGFSLSGSFNYDFTDEELFKKPVFIDGWNFLTDVVTLSGTGRTYVTYKDSKQIRHFGDVVARYVKSLFDDRLDLSAMAGASQEQYLSKNFTTTKYDLVDLNLDALAAATGDATAGGSATDWAMRSYFGRINLGWDDKYLLEFNLRADASSRFLEDQRWGYFPSFSAAWRIDQENFMSSLSQAWLSSLKLRASYGSLGNNSIGSDPNANNYAAIATFAQSNYTWGDALVVGQAQTAIANALLSWETTYVANIGVDFGVWNNRLTGTIDVFNKTTKDILINLPAPSVHGTATIPIQNAATVINNGVELTFGWQDKAGHLNYGVNGNITFTKNKVEKFKGDDYSLDGVNYIKEGLPINSQYMLKVDRIIQTDEDLAIVDAMVAEESNAFAAFGRPEKGDFLYQDVTGDGLINNDDRTIVSDGNHPNFVYGLNAFAEYKGIDFSILIQGVSGVKVYWQGAHYNTPSVRYGYQLNKEVVEGRWYEGRTDATYPRLLQYQNTRNTMASDFYLENKSYLKIRNVQLGYSLPKTIAQKLFLQRFRVYGSLENFFTFTSYKGLDPEVSGVAYPSMKQAVIGVNLTF